jgi:hypothetical protein
LSFSSSRISERHVQLGQQGELRAAGSPGDHIPTVPRPLTLGVARCSREGPITSGFFAFLKRFFDVKIQTEFHQADPGLPEITILVTAMLQAREVAQRRPWSLPQEPVTESWWADVLADPRLQTRRQPRGFYGQPSPTRRSQWHAANARGAQHSPAQTWLRLMGPITPCPPYSIDSRRLAAHGLATNGTGAGSTISIRSLNEGQQGFKTERPGSFVGGRLLPFSRQTLLR